MTFLAHVADRVLNRPLLITPEKAQVVLSVLANRIGVDGPSADRFEGERIERDQNGKYVGEAPYPVKDGVAIISMVGSLVNRGAFVGASSGLVSYEGLKHQVKHARQNDRVHSAVLDSHSFGGEAIGAFEAAEQVRLLAAEKRTVAVVNGVAASAAYAIISGATEIVTTETGVSGSIGVVLLHADFSRNLANEGITPTLIFAGGHKVDGNPFEPLPEAVREDLQAEVNAFYQQFLSTVAKGRGGRLTASKARKTEARTFIGAAAVEQGLADRLGTFESVLADLTGARGGRSNSRKGNHTMSENNGGPAAGNDAGISQADHEAAVSAAREQGRQAGATAERERLAGLLADEALQEDSRRMAAALDLAIKSPGMAADDIKSFVTKRVAGEADPAQAAASLESRRSDTDPIGEVASNGDKPAPSGLSRLITAQVDKMTRR